MAGRGGAIKINVDRPETKSMFYAFDPTAAGSYVWRVRPGTIVAGGEVGQGPWSPAAVFTIHPSVTDRIRATGRLLVASTPTSYDIGVNSQGGYGGFELKVLRWLLPRLAEKLNLKQAPSLEIEEIPWNRLFNYMQNGEADIAVRSITRSETREKEYQNLKFTVGYVRNHQIFVQPKNDGKFPDSLKGSTVGAKSRSVNESVAKFLAQRFGYNVNSTYTAYGDVLEGLRRGEIAFAVVDSSLVNELLGKSIFALGGHLDGELRQFYQRELGFDHEEYSILVHEGGSSELRMVLNEILSSDEYTKFAAALKVEPPPK
jgi:ABC-type amino acid transport substrate-binding protein